MTVVLVVIMLTVNIRVLGPWMSHHNAISDGDHACQDKIEVHIVSQSNVSSFSLNLTSLALSLWNTDQLTIVGSRRKEKGFLAIGIPSIKRINGFEYLMETLASIDQETSTKEKSENVVIVFLADFDTSYNNRTAMEIALKYGHHLQSGFIQVLQVSKDYYPPLENLKRNFNDEPSRVSWRAKQVMDYALMFLYSRDLASYYIQLEDDVTCGKNFVAGIRQYINLKTHDGLWAMLEFSELGFIGKLFKSSDLEKLATFMTLFYEEQPVDWLMNYFRMSMGQGKIFLRKPTLFQHIGLKSSFDITKDNKLKDRFFESGIKPWVADNPPAALISDMPPFESNTVDLAYSSGSGYFWAAKVEAGNIICLVFEQKQQLSKIIVETGSEKSPDDRLRNGTVFVGSKVGPMSLNEADKICEEIVPISHFVNGRAEADLVNKGFTASVSCIKILVTETQANWVVFYQIAVFVVK